MTDSPGLPHVSDHPSPRLPNVVYGVAWVDGDSGNEYQEFDTVEGRPDPADVETRSYVARDALLSEDVVERAARALHEALCGCELPMSADESYHQAARAALTAALGDPDATA